MFVMDYFKDEAPSMTPDSDFDAYGILKELTFYNPEMIRDMVGQIDKDKARKNYMDIVDMAGKYEPDKM